MFKGEGQADNEWPSVENTSGWIDPDTSSEITTSFAPQGPIRNPKSRRKPPLSLNLEGPSSKGLVAQIHNSCSVSGTDWAGRMASNVHLRRALFILALVGPRMPTFWKSFGTSSLLLNC